MKHKALLLLSLSLLAAGAGLRDARAQASNRTVLTYQGVVKQDGVPAHGPVDMTWRIYDAETNGNLMAEGQVSQVQVKDGLFTLPLDLPALGDNALPPPDGSLYGTWWMEFCLRFPNIPACRLMSPRQRITPTVQALSARVASTVRDGAVTAAKLASGAVNTSSLQNGAVTAAKIGDNQIVRSINAIRDDVTISAGEGLEVHTVGGNNIQIAAVSTCGSTYSNCFWNLRGNGNIVPGVNYLGTIAGELAPLEFRVDGTHAMRMERAVGTPNLIGGYLRNTISGAGSAGSTIAGGGDVSGWHTIIGSFSSIGGGKTNRAFAGSATIAGGELNWIDVGAHYGTIGGGNKHIVSTNAAGATISGGSNNVIQMRGMGSTIAGGFQGVIRSNATFSTIGGGGGNEVTNDISHATAGGGQRNLIHSFSNRADYATIPGGRQARANHYGQFAYASGRFASEGDAQTSLYVLRGMTATTAPAELFLDGLGQRMVLPIDSTWTFEVMVAARTDNGFSGGWIIQGVIERQDNVTMMVAPPTVTALSKTELGWSVTVGADNTHEALVINVSPGTTSVGTIRWVASTRTTEVIF